MTAIPLKELISLTDEEIKKRNPDEANKYIKLRDVLLITETIPSEPEKKENKVLSAKRESKKEPQPSPQCVIAKPNKPKRKCSEKQLAALAAGRAKNPRLIKSKENK